MPITIQLSPGPTRPPNRPITTAATWNPVVITPATTTRSPATTTRYPITKPPRPVAQYTTTKYPLKTTTKAPTKVHFGSSDIDKETEGCGSPVLSVYLIQNGETTQKDSWPWLVAIFKKTQVGLDFHCGGSLVTLSHVVTGKSL